MPPKDSAQHGNLKVYSARGATVERKDCHKNRYAEYICRPCLAKGRKFTHDGRLRYRASWRHVMKWVVPVLLLCVVIAYLAFPAIWIANLTFDYFLSAGKEIETPIRPGAGVPLRPEIKAPLNEDPGQASHRVR